MKRRSVALPFAAALLLTVRCRSPEGTVRGDVYDFSVTPATVQLARHDTARLHTTVVNMDNEVLTGVPVTYTSNNPSLVTVDQFGLVRSVGPLGGSSITVSVQGVQVTHGATVTVFAVLADFTLTPAETSMAQGDSVQLTTTMHDTAGIPITGASVSYVATGPIQVLSTGMVHSTGSVGEARVTASYQGLYGLSRIHVMDSALTGRVTAFGRPLAVAVSRTGTALVTRTLAVFLTRLDLPLLVAAQIRVPVGLTAVTFDTLGARAYALDPAGWVDVLDLATNQQVDSFPIPGIPKAVVVSRDNLLLFVANDQDSLYRYDRATFVRLGAVALPAPVTDLIRHPLDPALLYLACPDSGLVLEYDIPRDSIRRRLTLGGTPSRLAIAPDGSELYAGDAAGKAIHLWSLPGDSDVANIPLVAAASGLGITPGGQHLWVSLQSAGLVLELNPASRSIERSINVGGAPRGLAVSPVDATVVISNDSGWVDVAK